MPALSKSILAAAGSKVWCPDTWNGRARQPGDRDSGSHIHARQTFWLAALLAFFHLFMFEVDTAADNQRSEYVNTASGGSSALITPHELSKTTLYAFPIIDISQTTTHKADVDAEARTELKADRPPSGSGHIARTISEPEASGLRTWSKEEVQELIRIHSANVGIDPRIPLAIAYCESGWSQFSKNRSSSASGVFQYLAASTWRNTSEGRKGTSVFDADANIRMAISHMAVHGTDAWNASRHCWDKPT